MDWGFTLYDAGLPNPTGCPSVSFDKVDTINQQPLILGIGKSDLALLAPILPGDNQHSIVFFNLHRH
jgi:hypothetical protein